MRKFRNQETAGIDFNTSLRDLSTTVLPSIIVKSNLGTCLSSLLITVLIDNIVLGMAWFSYGLNQLLNFEAVTKPKQMNRNHNQTKPWFWFGFSKPVSDGQFL